MEQHPVPQNVTSFEFRLIGEMTVKQFVLLSAGIATGYVFLQLPLPSIIRIPLAGFFGFIGIAFAFLPYEDRPLHRWLWAFIKSVYSPTQFIFKKSEELPLYLSPSFPASSKKIIPVFQVGESRQKLEEYLRSLPRSLPTNLDIKEDESLKKIQALLGTIASLSSQKSRPPVSISRLFRPQIPEDQTAKPQGKEGTKPTLSHKLAFTEGGRLLFEEEKKNAPTLPFADNKIANRSELLVAEIKRLKDSISSLQKKRLSPQISPREVLTYEEQLAASEKALEKAEEEKEGLMQAMLRLQKELTEKPKGMTPTEVLESPQAVKIVSSAAAKAVGIPRLTDIPGIISGIVEDRKGSFLPNILVEVKNANGNSVRAFKTNKIGQFAAATPLENGTYTLELEDPRREFVFDIIEVKADGSVLPPLVISAKGQEYLEKEQIRRSLFGGE